MNRRADARGQVVPLSDPEAEAALAALEMGLLKLHFAVMRVRAQCYLAEQRGDELSPRHVGRFAAAAAALEGVRAPMRGTPGFRI